MLALPGAHGPLLGLRPCTPGTRQVPGIGSEVTKGVIPAQPVCFLLVLFVLTAVAVLCLVIHIHVSKELSSLFPYLCLKAKE